MSDDTIRVLLVDDDQGDYEMTRAMISEIRSRDLDLEWVATFEEGIDALEAGRHDVYLVDYFLEDRTGLDFLREARRRQVRVPLIMLTGRGNRSVDLQAMEAGAADYLVKGRIDPELLERSIRFALARNRADSLEGGHARFQVLFEELAAPVALVDSEGAVLDANPSFLATFEGPDEAAAGLSLADLVVRDERRVLLQTLRNVGDGTADRAEADHRFRDHEGREHHLRAKIRRVRSGGGSSSPLLVILESPDS